MTVEQVQDVLVTVAPIIGAPRVLAAAQNITDALGIVIAINTTDADPSRLLSAPDTRMDSYQRWCEGWNGQRGAGPSKP